MFVSGDLLVTLAKKSDSGQYICEVINEEGIDIASSNVLVKGKYIDLQNQVSVDILCCLQSMADTQGSCLRPSHCQCRT